MQPFLLNTDHDPKNQPDKTSRLNINANLNYEEGSISTEDGNTVVSTYPTPQTPGAITIGKIPINDGKVVLFSAINDKSYFPEVSDPQYYCCGEIGILFPDNSYSVLLRDNYPNASGGEHTYFGWTLNTQIQGVYKNGPNGETIVYFTDFQSGLRYLNIDNLGITTDAQSRIVSKSEMNKLFVLAPYTNQTIQLDNVSNNGNLKTGAYYTVLVPADEHFNEANPLFASNPVSIVDEINTLPIESYDGAVAGSPSPKSFTISVASPDAIFSYYRVYVIAKINQVYTVYDHGYQPIVSGTFSYVVSTNDNKPTSTLDVLINKVNWVSKTISQNDSKLYIANLKETERPNLQPWFNGIVVDISTSEKTPTSFSDSYHNEGLIYSSKSFQYDEVYAIYGSVVWADGTESELYHIPGRDATIIDILKDDAASSPSPGNPYARYNEDDDVTAFASTTDPGIYNGGGLTDTSPAGEMYNIDPDFQLFQVFDTSYNSNTTNVKGLGVSTNMGFWENRTETYPDTTDWIIRDSGGNIVGEDLRGKKVRHHKMPGSERLQSNYNKFNLLSLKFKNVIFPATLSGEIVGVNFYYAKRSNNNRLVLGQSILTQDMYMCKSGFPNSGVIDGAGQDSLDYVFSMGSSIGITGFDSGGNVGSAIRDMIPRYNRFRMSPFDIMYGNIDASSSSHIKIFKTLKGNFEEKSGGAQTISDSSGNLNYNVRLYYNVTTATDTSKRASWLRRVKGTVKTAESIPEYPNGDVGFANNTGQLGYDKNTVHYRNDKHLIIQTYNEIDPSINYPDGLASFTDPTNTINGKNIALANICQHKTDIYYGFDAQEVIFTGVVNPVTNDMFGPGDLINSVGGGDVFVNWESYRGCSDILAALNMDLSNPARVNYAGEWRTLHYYICESSCNVAYRNQGTGQYDIYYPKSSIHSVVNVPLLPYGFGNYYGYNKDYNSINDLRSPKLHQKSLIPNVVHHPDRIARSQADNYESVIDNLRIFLPNEYTDIDKSKGAITNIHFMGGRMVIECEDGIKVTATRDRIKTDSGEAFLGAGDIFDYPPKDIMIADSGYAGLKHQYASILTQYGIFFPDTDSSKIFLIEGDRLNPISDEGMYVFCLDHMRLNFEQYIKTKVFGLLTPWQATAYLVDDIVFYNNSVWQANSGTLNTDIPYSSSLVWDKLFDYNDFTFDGIDSVFYGYIAGFDNYYRRYLLTKKDITTTQDFENNFYGYYQKNLFASWPTDIAIFMYNNKFYIKRGSSGYKIIAIDGIYYGEEIFLNNSLYFTPNRFTLSYYPDYKGWASWYEYYPDNYIFNRTDIWKTNGSFLSKLNDDTTVLIPDNNGPVDTTIEPIFNNAEPVRLLSTQWKSKAIDLTGGEDPLTTFDSIQAYDSYQISKQSTLSNTNNTRNLEGYWSCNDFRDYAVSNTAQMVDTSVWYRPFNTLNIAANKHWTKLKKLVDFWFGVRFKYAPYTITPLVLTGTKRLTVPYYSADFNPTIVTMTITPDIAISVGSILQIVVNGSTVYAKVLSGSAPDWTVKLYGNMSITGTNNTITSASLITKRHKLHLLDITKLVIKNIR